MNYQEIINVCEKEQLSPSDYGYGKFPTELGEVNEVFRKGGEGEGSDWERVYYFTEHNVYMSVTAYYQSYDGCDFDGAVISEVKPTQKTITVYE